MKLLNGSQKMVAPVTVPIFEIIVWQSVFQNYRKANPINTIVCVRGRVWRSVVDGEQRARARFASNSSKTKRFPRSGKFLLLNAEIRHKKWGGGRI